MFSELVLIACYAPDIILGVRNIEVNNTKSLHSKSLYLKNLASTCPIQRKTLKNIFFNQIRAVTKVLKPGKG